MAKRYLGLIVLVMLGLFIAGCDKGSDDSTVTNPNPSVFEPKGSISGVVFDTCKNLPVPGAKVSVAYGGSTHSVTTEEDGTFSFNDVPCNTDRAAALDVYTVVCDLTDVASTFAVYGYATAQPVDVYYDDLEDGQNNGIPENGTESGSGADTPVNNLAATVNFEVAAPNASISGVIYDVTNTKAVTTATVMLLNAETDVIAATTTSDATTGAYTFSNVVPNTDYNLIIKKAGYVIAPNAMQAPNTVAIDDDVANCYTAELDCEIPCEYDITGVDVKIWANPDTDITAPYITSVTANGTTTEVYDEDDITASLTSLVINFSEAMDTGHTPKDNSILVVSEFTVTVETDGPAADIVTDDVDVIDWANATLTWNTAATALTITFDNLTSAELLAAGVPHGAWDVENCTATIASTGWYRLSVTEDMSHLADANFVPWCAGTTIGTVQLNPKGNAYQQLIIFNGGNDADTLDLNLVE